MLLYEIMGDALPPKDGVMIIYVVYATAGRREAWNSWRRMDGSL